MPGLSGAGSRTATPQWSERYYPGLPGLFLLKDGPSWTGAHSRRTGYAAHVPAAAVLALIDPPPLTPDECVQLEALGPPTHILLTCNWHLRGSEAYRRRWKCPILIHEAGLATADTIIDGTFRIVGDVAQDVLRRARWL